MVTPVIQLPPDRLAGLRPGPRGEPRPSERDSAGHGQGDVTAAGSFDALTRANGAGGAVARIGDHAGQRRADRQLQNEAGSAAESQRSAQTPPRQAEADAQQRAAT